MRATARGFFSHVARLSARCPYPVGDGPPDFIRRVFLDVMDPRDRHLSLRRQPRGFLYLREASVRVARRRFCPRGRKSASKRKLW
jgi:hypothetical protein